jgi:outer membrane lipoprotein-sorting protein
MRYFERTAGVLALIAPLLITGCSLFPTTRKLPVPKAPTITQTVSPEDLVDRLNKRWDAIHTLTATVEIQASVIKTKEGSAKDYPTLHGFILMRKPAMLRVVGQYLGVRAFNMGSDGKTFTLSIPTQDKVIKGPAKLNKKLPGNPLYNLRPDFFFDALLVRGLDPDDEYMVTADTITVEDAARKHLFAIPEYKLSVMRTKPGSQLLTPLRVVYFHRDDLQPYQQDVYDSEGNLETQVFYDAYRDFDGSTYPSRITLKRPIEEIQIILSVDQVKENQPLGDDQFVVEIPANATVQTLE